MMELVDSYLALRRAVGFELKMAEYMLRSFARYASERGELYVCASTVIDWARQASSLPQRDERLKTVIRFADIFMLKISVTKCRREMSLAIERYGGYLSSTPRSRLAA